MNIVSKVSEVRSLVKAWKKEGLSVGLVPTMGYLHEGHLSLIKKCRRENDKVVVSIFVNPTQFGENEDLSSYPRDLKADSALCESAGVDLIFNPTPEEMYLDPHAYVNINDLSKNLCGKSRPIHFKGVCTVVSKLFNIVTPDRAYFGEKDAQQLAIIKKMVKDLNFDVKVVGCPIVREKDNLAKSSRNFYLNEEERQAALVLSKALELGKNYLIKNNNVNDLKEIIVNEINREPLAKIDYVEVVDSLSIEPVSKIEKDILVAVAVYIGNTRLIDNFTFNGGRK
ncbi:pantoate--beta-alanine ligase [Fusobacterium sp. MFO224]|uniref:pantoate--beta-alanine ligase n=1 Tax=Fusobacterium sp. MFO224 TaxID=3378070 RepID=UPI0038532FC1